MKILSYRTGFAANSSSMHSPMIVDNIDDVIEERFGKGFYLADFTIKDKKTLLEYLGAQINTTMNYHANCMPGYRDDPYMNKIIIDGLLGVELFTDPDKYSIENLCVQSDMAGWLLPHRKGCFRRIPDHEFISDLKSYLLKNNIVISGCNLNYKHKKNEKSFNNENKFNQKESLYLNKLSDLGGGDNWFSYKEDGVWRLFNTDDGTKIRFAMDDRKEIKYATTPELIDVIISDRCSNGCEFCYRNCKSNSHVAELIDIERIFEMIRHTNTSEVAIGGGDILAYPYLAEMLKLIEKYSSYEIMFNSTINFKSLGKKKNEEIILDRIARAFKSIAISVEKTEEINIVINKYNYIFKENNCFLSFQIIPELFHSYDELTNIIKKAASNNNKVTLLGFKEPCNNERLDDKLQNQIDMMRTKESVKKISKLIFDNINHLQCDTQFLKNYPSIQKHLTSGTFEVEEGIFSCCINAINQRLYKSSYQLENSFLLYDRKECKKKGKYIIDYGNRNCENPILKGFRTIHFAEDSNS